MNCRKIKPLLVSFLENDLSKGCREKVEAHLKVCTNCQKEKELLSKSWQMLDNYAAPKLKDDFTSFLMGKIHSEQEEQEEIVRVRCELPRFSFDFGVRRLAPALASFLIVILIVVLLWKRPVGKEQLAELPPPELQEVPEVLVEIAPFVPEVSIEKPLRTTAPVSKKVATVATDEEIIRNLNLYENIDFLENLDLLEELDVVENLDTLT